ncbi:MAG: hypothetical protein WDZ37_05560 [Solirubrobacterales bacterium]
MAENDPTNTGGLFIGRRPGTGPVRYRGKPEPGDRKRRRIDSILAGAILVVETILLVTLWGPQPAGWLWVASRIQHRTDSIELALATAFIGMMVTMVGTIGLAMRLDHAWKLVRRAAGHEQKEGMLNRIFVISGAIAVSAFMFWFVIINGPGSSVTPGQ